MLDNVSVGFNRNIAHSSITVGPSESMNDILKRLTFVLVQA